MQGRIIFAILSATSVIFRVNDAFLPFFHAHFVCMKERLGQYQYDYPAGLALCVGQTLVTHRQITSKAK